MTRSLIVHMLLADALGGISARTVASTDSLTDAPVGNQARAHRRAPLSLKYSQHRRSTPTVLVFHNVLRQVDSDPNGVIQEIISDLPLLCRIAPAPTQTVLRPFLGERQDSERACGDRLLHIGVTKDSRSVIVLLNCKSLDLLVSGMKVIR